MDLVNLVTPYLSLANALEAALLVLSVAGQEFISKRNSRGFNFWMAGNVCAIVLFSLTGRPMMVLLYVYFFVKCVQGLRNWRRLEAGERTNEERAREASAKAQAEEAALEVDPEQAFRSEMGERVAGIAYAQLLDAQIIGHIGLNSCAGVAPQPEEAAALAPA